MCAAVHVRRKISEWEGCYVRDPNIFNQGCDQIGAFSNDIEFECVYNATQMPTIGACLDSTYCPYVREEVRHTRHATRDTRHATRDTRHATRDTRHATRDTRHATRDTHRKL